MSLISSLLKKGTIVEVKSQYDHSNISSNQCSWCAYEFIEEQKQLRTLLSDIPQFTDLYNECVVRGSIKRKENNVFLYGENIDDINVSLHYKNLVVTHTYKTILNTQSSKILDEIDRQLKDRFFQRQGAVLVSFIGFREILRSLKETEFIVINRFGQSFAILKFKDSNYFLLDSHCRTTGLINFPNLINYITFNNNEGYNFILWSKGKIVS